MTVGRCILFVELGRRGGDQSRLVGMGLPDHNEGGDIFAADAETLLFLVDTSSAGKCSASIKNVPQQSPAKLNWRRDPLPIAPSFAAFGKLLTALVQANHDNVHSQQQQ